jgi:hypothetical protein
MTSCTPDLMRVAIGAGRTAVEVIGHGSRLEVA